DRDRWGIDLTWDQNVGADLGVLEVVHSVRPLEWHRLHRPRHYELVHAGLTGLAVSCRRILVDLRLPSLRILLHPHDWVVLRLRLGASAQHHECESARSLTKHDYLSFPSPPTGRSTSRIARLVRVDRDIAGAITTSLSAVDKSLTLEAKARG